MSVVCEVCGDIGYRQLLLCCTDCNSCAVHQYCLEKVVFDASLIKWFCYECLQRRGEVPCVSSLEKVSSERPLSHAHSCSPLHQLITKSLESARNAGQWRNKKHKSFGTEYTLNKIYPLIKKHTKKKSMKPMGPCTNRRVRIAKVTTHTNAEASCSCETIGTESTKSNHGKNQQVDHGNPIALSTAQPCPLIMNSLGTLGDSHQSDLLETTEGSTCKLKRVPQSVTTPFEGLEKRENVVLGSNNRSSCSTADLGNSVFGNSGDKSNTIKDSGANLSSKHTDPGNQANQHTSVGYKNMEGKAAKAKKNVLESHENTFWAADSHRNSKDKSEAHVDSNGSESSERSTECQKASCCRRGKTLKMTMASPSSKESEDNISGNISLEYVLACRSYLSKAQKKRVMKLIQEIQPEFTIFISIMRRNNVQPPGPFLGITKEYAIAHFPDKSTDVTLETPGKNKKWHAKFYKRDESRKNLIMGRWLDFVRDNHVEEGDICLLLPKKDERRCTFMVYVLHQTTHSRGGAGFQRVGPCPGASHAKMASEIHFDEEPTSGEHVSSKSDMQEIFHEPLESRDSDDPFEPKYFVPCRNPLSRSQKRIVEKRVEAIRSEVPICVAVMKNNNIGVAQRWMLELCSRYASVYLPTQGQSILLQCEGKTWEAKIMFHNGRRWFINGGWPNFDRGNGLRVGDVCLFELKKKETKLTMAVHIIRKEQF